MENSEKLVYTLTEWASLFGVSPASAYNWARQNKIAGLIKLGERRYCVSKAIVQEELQNGNIGHN